MYLNRGKYNRWLLGWTMSEQKPVMKRAVLCFKQFGFLRIKQIKNNHLLLRSIEPGACQVFSLPVKGRLRE
ncbi:MAG: hypothetical protein C4563_09445 [Desulfobulbus sp.]|nr:MAG: hypothetical protein C4563_09445 [Desulfobulbus sp.]